MLLTMGMSGCCASSGLSRVQRLQAPKAVFAVFWRRSLEFTKPYKFNWTVHVLPSSMDQLMHLNKDQHTGPDNSPVACSFAQVV